MITLTLLHEWQVRSDAHLTEHFNKYIALSPRQVADEASLKLEDQLLVICHALAHRAPVVACTFAIECVATTVDVVEDADRLADHVASLRRILALPKEQWFPALERWHADLPPKNEDAWTALRYAGLAVDVIDVLHGDVAHLWSNDLTRYVRNVLARRVGDAAKFAVTAHSSNWTHAARASIKRALEALGTDADGWAEFPVQERSPNDHDLRQLASTCNLHSTSGRALNYDCMAAIGVDGATGELMPRDEEAYERAARAWHERQAPSAP